MLDEVNKNKEMQSHLFNSHFTIANVEVTIFNNDKQGYEIYSPGIAAANIANSILTFHITGRNDAFRYKEHYEGTYQEALQLLENKNKVIK